MIVDSISGVTGYQQGTVKPAPTVQATEFKDESVGTIPMTDVKISNAPEMGNGSEDFEQPTLEQMKKAVDSINKKANNSTVQFGIHEETNRITVKIVDKETNKVIKEVPAEKTLDMIAKAWELAGILVDEKR